MRADLRTLALAALVASCGTNGSVGPGPRAHGPILTSADRADPVSALRRAGAGDAMTPQGAEQLFGPADVERRDGAGAILTWRTQTCAIALAFAADRLGDLRLGASDIGAKDQRAPAPPLEQCVREALARRGAP